MRFFEDGPDIPDELLHQCDRGQVVFLCGAGVSVPTGLPTFKELTERIIEGVGADRNQEIAQAFAPWKEENREIPEAARASFDQILNLISTKYSKNEITNILEEELKKDLSLCPSPTHRILLDLSKSPQGKPQIVTTNYDHLFEQEDYPKFTPPMLPDIEHHGASPEGITYLHGRLRDDDQKPANYVLSSSDFGRAYLAEGWATKYVRQLLKKHTVVLIGYKAEDPPVKYLLQGLNADKQRNPNRLFAFDSGTKEEVSEKWSDRGVSTIEYKDTTHHEHLWNTLEAWAKRKAFPYKWRQSIIELASTNPKDLKPFQRGMVTHLVCDPVGMQEFSNADPSPNPEWICVFDVRVRYGKPYKPRTIVGSDKEGIVDPLDYYQIDNDVDRPIYKTNDHNSTLWPESAIDVLAWMSVDESVDSTLRLSNGRYPSSQALPKRLENLGQWILKHLNSPVIAWWAARQGVLFPWLKTCLKRFIWNESGIDPHIIKIWQALILGLEKSETNHPNNWYVLSDKVKKEGWSAIALRQLDKCLISSLEISTPISGTGKSIPDFDSFNKDLSLNHICDYRLCFPYINYWSNTLDVSDSDLLPVITIVQQKLFQAINLMEWSGNQYIYDLKLYGRNLDADIVTGESITPLLYWYIELLERLIEVNVNLFNGFYLLWPENDVFLLLRLRLYFWNKAVFSASLVSEKLILMNVEEFWDYDNRIELFHLLADRWNEFDSISQANLLGILMIPRPNWGDRPNDEYQKQKYDRAVNSILWLEKRGANIDPEVIDRVVHLKGGLDYWNDTSVDNFINNTGSRAEWVKKDESISVFDGEPIENIIPLALENTKSSFHESVEYRPFTGLVKEEPDKALKALRAYPQPDEDVYFLWKSLFSCWPSSVSNELTIELAEEIFNFTDEYIWECRYEIIQWVEKNIAVLVLVRKSYPLQIIQLLVYVLELSDEEINSPIIIPKSGSFSNRYGIQYAINSPTGKISLMVLKFIEGGEDNSIAMRILSQLLKLSGDGKHHALCPISRNSEFLYHIEEYWFRENLVPCFDLNHPIAFSAWGGIFHSTSWYMVQDFWDSLKGDFLRLPVKLNEWGEETNWINMYAWLVLAFRNYQELSVGINQNEARLFVSSCTEKQKKNLLEHFLRYQAQDKDWALMICSFIESCWPRENNIRTQSLTESWCSLLCHSNEYFGNIYSSVKEYLVPVTSVRINFSEFHYECGSRKTVAMMFPDESLDFFYRIVTKDFIDKYSDYDILPSLGRVIEAKPELEKDLRYIELKRLLAGG